MLDTEPTGADGDQTPGAVEQNRPADPPARSRRRRAAAPPPIDPPAPVAAEPAAPVKAPRKRTPRKATAATTANPTPSPDTAPAEAGALGGEAAEMSAPAAAGSGAPAAGARGGENATPSATAAVGEGAQAGAGAPAASAAVGEAAASEAPAPAKRTRSRRSATAAAGSPPAAAPAAGDDGSGDVAAAVTAATVTQTDETTPKKRTRSRRAAAAPAGPPAHVEPTMAPPAAVSSEPGAQGADVPPDVAAPAEPPRRRRSRATKATAADQARTDVAETHAADAAGAAAGDATTEPPVTAEPSRQTAAAPFTDAPAEPTRRGRRRATAPETSPPPAPAVMFVAPTEAEAPAPRRRRATAPPAQPDEPVERVEEQAEEPSGETRPRRRRRTRSEEPAAEPTAAEATPVEATPVEATDAQAAEDTEPEETEDTEDTEDTEGAEGAEGAGDRRRRRRGRRGRGRSRANGEAEETDEAAEQGGDEAEADEADETAEDGDRPSSRRRRRRRRRGGGVADGEEPADDDPPDTVVHVREGAGRRSGADDEVRAVRGSTRLEAKRQRRREGRDTGRRRPPILSEAEFLARREAVDRKMVVRQRGDRTQIAVLEDDILVEHYVTKASSTSYAGNVYLGRVQNVLPSMEAAFVDIGKGRNAVLYAGEVNWDVAGLEGRARSIEHALKSGDSIVVQVTKDPIGHKGARLTSQVSLPGRYLVYVPNGSMTGISRKLPDTERARLKDILRRIVPNDAGVIIRTAAEGASEDELTRDVQRLQSQWESIQRKAAQTKSAPTLLYAEPDLELRVVRDVFNEDFTTLIVSGEDAWTMISQYVDHVAPDLLPRLERWTGEGDAFADLRIDEQLLKGLDRKVWLPSGGSLVIDRTEAMTVIDVNTGKFVGQGGNLEQTVTRNNLEAAEEIVRQLRLRDIGGIIVIDFIDMVLESNRDLVLRRLTECLGRDRTKHQVAEVTSLGLVQMTRKRVGQGLLEAFSEPCPTCGGRGLLVHTEPVDDGRKKSAEPAPRAGRRGRRGAVAEAGPPTPALLAGRSPQGPTPDEVDVASEDHRVADEAVDTVEAVEPEAEVTVRDEAELAATVATLPLAVPDPNAGPPNAPEPVVDPEAPASALAAGRPSASELVVDPAGPASAPVAGRASASELVVDPEAPASGPAATPTAGEPATAGTGRRRGRRRAEAAAGSPSPTTPEAAGAADAAAAWSSNEAGVDLVATGGGGPGGTGRPDGPDGGTTPDGSEPVAGSNGVVASGTDAAEFPPARQPVADSNGAVEQEGSDNGAAPRRRRRTASRPAGPPQPVSSD